MELQSQVCSLELAKILKELGVKQESLFYWDVIDENVYSVKFIPYSHPSLTRYSAFTVSELGNIIPNVIQLKNDNGSIICGRLTIEKLHEKWWVYYFKYNDDIYDFSNVKLSDSLAEMLIYVLENKLMESPNAIINE